MLDESPTVLESVLPGVKFTAVLTSLSSRETIIIIDIMRGYWASQQSAVRTVLSSQYQLPGTDFSIPGPIFSQLSYAIRSHGGAGVSSIIIPPIIDPIHACPPIIFSVFM